MGREGPCRWVRGLWGVVVLVAGAAFVVVVVDEEGRLLLFGLIEVETELEVIARVVR